MEEIVWREFVNRRLVVRINKEYLQQKYEKELLSPCAIGKLIGVSDVTVRKCIRENGIRMRTPSETNRITRKKRTGVKNGNCSGCIYQSAPLGGQRTCDYILITGHSRGCDVENCDKKEIKRKKRRASIGENR